jgi:L-amino acid N-acyltransferase YncA
MIKYREIRLVIGADAKVISMAAYIRFARLTDAAGILAIYGPYCETTCVSFEIVAPSVEKIQERISRITIDYPWLVAEVEGQIAGYVYASRRHERAAYRWSVDVAVYVAATQQRRGVGRILYETLFSILREQGYYKAFAGITLPNPASVGLHESLGFRSAGVFRGVGYKLGNWLDVGWWQLDLQPERDSPVNPQPFNSLCADPAIAAKLAEGKRKLAAKFGVR